MESIQQIKEKEMFWILEWNKRSAVDNFRASFGAYEVFL